MFTSRRVVSFLLLASRLLTSAKGAGEVSFNDRESDEGDKGTQNIV